MTATAEGQAEIEAFRQQLRDRGEIAAASVPFVVYSLPDLGTGDVPVACSVGSVTCDDVQVDPRDIHVYPSDPEHPVDTTAVDKLTDEGPLSSALVVPTGTVILVGGTVNLSTGGGAFLKTLMSSMPEVVLPGQTELRYDDPGESAEWTPTGGKGCVNRSSNNTAWYDHCQFWYLRSEDGDPDRSTYAFNLYGTGKSKGNWTLEDLEVESWRVPDSDPQQWVDWSPKSDMDAGNCVQDTVVVTVYGSGIEHTSSHCDKWDIDKGAAAADFSNHWRGDAYRSERSTDMMIATSVDSYDRPHDYVDFDYYAH